MTQLKLNRVACDNPQEDKDLFSRDGDEIYFQIDNLGGTARPKATNVIPGMDAHDVRNLTDIFSFSGYVGVSLFEKDGYGNPDDLISPTDAVVGGSNSIRQHARPGPSTMILDDNLVGTGSHDAVFEEAGVRYVLNYEVIA